MIKGTRVTLECDVDDYGSPSNISFQWFKGNYLFRDRNTSKWVINPVTLSDRTNFTCFAVNDGGRSKPHTVYINVLGMLNPQFLIHRRDIENTFKLPQLSFKNQHPTMVY